MPVLTSDLISAVRDQGFHYEDDPSIVRALNAGRVLALGEHLFPFLARSEQLTATSSGRLTLTAPLRALARVARHGESCGELGYLYRYDDRNPEETGRATHVVLEGAVGLRTWRVEAGLVVDVDYWCRHPAFTAAGSECLLPEDYSDALVDAAAVELAKKIRDWDAVSGFRQLAITRRDEMAEALINPQHIGHDRILGWA